MTNAQLQSFRDIAAAMTIEPTDWEWIGRHLSQRMFGITERRARAYAEAHGGVARKMTPVVDTDPRGPVRTIAAVHESLTGGPTRVDFVECSHVVERVNHFSYYVGDRDRCFDCRSERAR